MKCGNSCPDCGADVVWMYVRRIIKIFSQSPIYIFHRKFQLWKFWNWTTKRDMIRSCCSVSKIDWWWNWWIEFYPEQNNKLSRSPRSTVGSGEVEQRDDPSAGYNGIMDLDMFRATLVWPQLLSCWYYYYPAQHISPLNLLDMRYLYYCIITRKKRDYWWKLT